MRAEYTFRQLAEIRDIAFDQILGQFPGVETLDLDEARNRVTLAINNETFGATRMAVVAKLTALSVDTFAVAFRATGRTVLDRRFSAPGQITQQTSDPVVGGLVIDLDSDGNGAFAASCTLGFVAKRNGQLGLVTASHCSTNMFNPDVDHVYQRFGIGGNWVATMSVDPSAYTCGVQRCRGADAAFAAATSANMAVGKIIKTQGRMAADILAAMVCYTSTKPTRTSRLLVESI